MLCIWGLFVILAWPLFNVVVMGKWPKLSGPGTARRRQLNLNFLSIQHTSGWWGSATVGRRSMPWGSGSQTEQASGLLAQFWNCRFLGPGVSDVIAWGPRICISNKFSQDTDAFGPRDHTLRVRVDSREVRELYVLWKSIQLEFNI